MTMTRRDFGQLALFSVPAIAGLSTFGRFGEGLLAQADGSANRSTIDRSSAACSSGCSRFAITTWR